MLLAYIGGLVILAVSMAFCIVSSRFDGWGRLSTLVLDGYVVWLLVCGMRHLH